MTFSDRAEIPNFGNFSGILLSHGKQPILWVQLTYNGQDAGRSIVVQVKPEGSERNSDWQLVKRVQQGDHQAFDLLVIKYQHRVAGLVSRYVRVSADIADVTQETFIRAFRAIDSFRGDSAFYTWLFRIAVNTAKNTLASGARRAQDQAQDVDDPAVAAQSSELSTEGPDAELQRTELAEAVQLALERLPDELRTALVLREFEGMSYHEIAVVLGCPVGTVRSRIFRARDHLDRAIGSLM